MPDALKKYADAVVPWNAEKIMDAIEGKLTNWRILMGSSSPRSIARANC